MKSVLGCLISDLVFSGIRKLSWVFVGRKLLYTKAVNLLRVVLLDLAAIGVFLTLVSWGVIFFPLAVLFLAPWEWPAKLFFCLGVSILYLGLAYFIFMSIFTINKWMKKFNVECEKK